MKTPAQRGPIGNWLRNERTSRGWKDQQAVDELAKAGVYVPLSTYREYESGSRVPGAERVEALRKYFGTRPEAVSVPSNGTTDPALLAVLERQAEAIEAQADAINRLLDRLELREQTRMDEAVVAEFLAEHPEVSKRLLGQTVQDAVPAGERP